MSTDVAAAIALLGVTAAAALLALAWRLRHRDQPPAHTRW